METNFCCSLRSHERLNPNAATNLVKHFLRAGLFCPKTSAKTVLIGRVLSENSATVAHSPNHSTHTVKISFPFIW